MVRGRAEHTFREPVPIVARIVWADDGEKYLEVWEVTDLVPGRSFGAHAPSGTPTPT